jgi:hypothetical protein
MTRFELEDGTPLGVRFCGDAGATYHLTPVETHNLFNAALDDIIIDDNCSNIATVKDLIDDFLKKPKVSEEELLRRFKISKHVSLHFIN